MTNIIARWFLAALAILAAAYFVPGISVASLYTALIVAALLGVLNLVVKPVLVLLTLPLNLITLGLFTFVINAGILWFLTTIVKGFSINGFVPALLGALLISVVTRAGSILFRLD